MKIKTFNKHYNIHPFLIGITIFACLLPTLLNLAGINFGLSNPLIDLDNITTLNELEVHNQLHPLLVGKFAHTLLVAFSISIGFLTVILAFVDYSIMKNVSTPIVGVALFCASILDIVHILAADQMIKLNINTADISSFTWIFSRTFHALILILGVGIFLVQKKESVDKEYRSEKIFVLFISTIFILLTFNAILIVTDDGLKVPQMSYPNSFISHPYDLIPLVIYVIAAIFIFPEFYRQNPSTFSQTLILSLLPAIVTQLHMAFGSHEIFDNHFYIAHYMKSVSYFVPFLGLSLNYIETNYNRQQAIINLDTEVKEKEKAQNTLQSILDSSMSGIMTYKAIRDANNFIIDFQWTMVNPASLSLLDIKNASLIGERVNDKRFQLIDTDTFNKFKRVIEQRKPETYELYSTLNQKYFSVSIVKLGDGVAVTFNDVTERKNDLERIRKNEGLYKALAKNMPDSAVFLFDHNLRYTLADGSSLIDFNIDKNKIIGRYIGDIFTEEDKKIFIPKFQEALNGIENEFSYTYDNKHYHIFIMPVRNSEGVIFAGMAMAHDITELHTYQQQLELKLEDLNRSNKDLEQFAYVASHDLQEPLRKIRTFSDRLTGKYSENLNEEAKDYINRMQNAANRMQILIDDLLIFSRVSKPKENFDKLDLNKLVSEVIEDLEISIEQSNATITIAKLPEINAIQGQMRQLFQNLISNAIKFKKENEHPIISIQSELCKGNNYTGLIPEKSYVKISISDNGIGFDEKYIDRIFVIFQRLHGRSEYQGTGIGLAICKKIVEYHHGYISASSKLYEGSTFIILLPLNQKNNG